MSRRRRRWAFAWSLPALLVAMAPAAAGEPEGGVLGGVLHMPTHPARTTWRPKGQVGRLGTWRFRSGVRVYDLAFSPDGRFIAAATLEGFQIWHATTGRLTRHVRPTGHPHEPVGRLFADLDGPGRHVPYVSNLAYAAAGRTIVATLGDRTLRAFSTADQKEILRTRLDAESAGRLAVGRSGRLAAVDVGRGEIDLYALDGPAEPRRLKGHRQTVSALAFTADERRLASGGRDGMVVLWDPATGREIRRWETGARVVNGLAFTTDGGRLAVATDRAVRVYDAGTGEALHELPGAYRMALSGDGRTLVSGDTDGEIRIWDVPTGKERARIATGGRAAVQSIALSPDARHAAFSTGTHALYLIDVAAGRLVFDDPGHRDAVAGIAWTPDGRGLVSGSRDGTVRWWDVEAGRERHVLGAEDSDVLAVAVAPDGRHVAAGHLNGMLALWDPTASDPRPRRVWVGTRKVAALAFSPDAALLATGDGDKTVDLWSLPTGERRHEVKLAGDEILAVAFAPDGRWLAASTLSTPGAVSILDPATGRRLRALAPTEPATALAAAPDGRRLALGLRDGTIEVWVVEGGRRATSARVRESIISGLAYAPDGRTLAASDMDGRLQLFDADGRPLGHTDAPSGLDGLAFSPDGRRLAVAAEDSTVLLFDPTLLGAPKP